MDNFNLYPQKWPSFRGKITPIVLCRSNVYPVYEEHQNCHLKKKHCISVQRLVYNFPCTEVQLSQAKHVQKKDLQFKCTETGLKFI